MQPAAKNSCDGFNKETKCVVITSNDKPCDLKACFKYSCMMFCWTHAPLGSVNLNVKTEPTEEKPETPTTQSSEGSTDKGTADSPYMVVDIETQVKKLRDLVIKELPETAADPVQQTQTTPQSQPVDPPTGETTTGTTDPPPVKTKWEEISDQLDEKMFDLDVEFSQRYGTNNVMHKEEYVRRRTELRMVQIENGIAKEREPLYNVLYDHAKKAPEHMKIDPEKSAKESLGQWDEAMRKFSEEQRESVKNTSEWHYQENVKLKELKFLSMDGKPNVTAEELEEIGLGGKNVKDLKAGDVEKAFRKRALQIHPDKHHGATTEQFQKLGIIKEKLLRAIN